MSNSLIGAIVSGNHDDVLDTIIDAARERKKRVTRSSLAPGSRIVVTAPIKPRYLEGATGVVDRVNQTTATITLDRPYGRYRGGRFPLGTIKLAEETAAV